MRIDRIDLQKLKMPLKSPFETSFGRETHKEFLLVSVYSGDEVGYAECVAMKKPVYNEETIDTALSVLKNNLIPAVFQQEDLRPEAVTDLFKWVRRNNMAKSALESAIWDLYCKKENISLASALGGVKKEVEVGVSLGIEPTVEALLEKVEDSLKAGYKKIKVKIKPGKDVDRIQAIRERFGYEVPLMADANSAYTLDQIDTLKELDKYKLIMIEQPLAHDDIIDHAMLQSELETPVCLDESIHTLDDARKAIELGSCKIINIKIGRVGGLTESKRIHDYCEANNIPVWCGGMLESGVGRAHNLAIASLSNFVIPGDTSPSSRYWEQDIVTKEVVMSSPGMVEVPKGPGIGYEIDEKAVNKYLINKESLHNMYIEKNASYLITD
ncbi:o-succinylbenzoate synthase [Evansella clarkii]|uniref:o-succinylbenzoate synthase n=1 Tax=Evansella clarkii TaxID=79879 RepID=UPI0009988E30|nr:o-succinylbenzoate synthase [Evansella clarkii]